MAPVIATKPLSLLLPSSPATASICEGVSADRSGRSINIVDAGAADFRGFTMTMSGAVCGVAAIDLRRRAARRAAGLLHLRSSIVALRRGDRGRLASCAQHLGLASLGVPAMAAELAALV